MAPAALEALVRHGLLPASLVPALALRIFHGRPYLDLEALRRALLPRGDRSAVADRVDASGTWHAGLAPTRLLARAPLLPFRLMRGLIRLEVLERDARVTLQRLAQELEREPMSDWAREELTGLLRLRTSGSLRHDLPGMAPAASLANRCAPLLDAWLERIVTRWAGEPRASAAQLVSGLHDMVDVECAAALWDLAEEARRVPKLARALAEPPPRMARLPRASRTQPFLDGLHAFLNRFGHLGPAELELARPRWREDPEPVLTFIESYAAAAEEASPRVAEWQQHWEREAAVTRVGRELRFRPLRLLAFRSVLAAAQRASVALQNTSFELARLLALLRAAALELGRRLAREGRLAAADDVFFLRLAELGEPEPAPDLPVRVAQRREQHARDSLGRPARLLDAAGEDEESAPRPAGDDVAELLRGSAASPGSARGRVRILHDPPKRGRAEVIVARHSCPGWTPLFAVANAVVLEDDAAACPAAIVARELGIPMVVGVRDATVRLSEGEAVEVDGTNGTVARLGASPAPPAGSG